MLVLERCNLLYLWCGNSYGVIYTNGDSCSRPLGAIQVNLDYESEQDMVEKMRIGLALQPLATALFANSPFRNGQDSGARPAVARRVVSGVGRLCAMSSLRVDTTYFARVKK